MTEHLTQWTPTARELDDLELITGGYLPDVTGFGRPVRGAVTLVVSDEVAREPTLELLDPEGLPLARLEVTDTYPADGGTGVVGPVTALTHPQYGPFRRYFRAPSVVRPATSVPVTRPLTDNDIAGLRALGGPLTLVVLAGSGSRRPLTPPGLVRATLAAAGLLPDATVVAAPVADRPDPADDAAFAARVAAGYGPVHELGDPTGDLPAEVTEALGSEALDRAHRGLVVFFTGLSGSGKSTIARALHDHLLERGDRTVTSLDGDVVRHHLSKGLTFSKQDRETNIARIGWVAAEIGRHHGIAICSPIAPFDSTRKYVRALAADARAGFCLVHVATPLEECERRDRKGLYAKARQGLIPEFTGISSPYEEPTDAEVRVDTTGRTIEDCLADVLDTLRTDGWLPAA